MTESNPLLGNDVKMNQFRNAIYELILLLRKEKQMTNDALIKEIKDMGFSIFETYQRFWQPDNGDPLDVIQQIHQFVFKRKVKLQYLSPEEVPSKSSIQVTDRKCCFCKYARPDVGRIAGCNIVNAIIEKYLELIHESNPSIPLYEGSVRNSKTFGDKSCIHIYEVKGG